MDVIPSALFPLVRQWHTDWFQLHRSWGVWFVCATGAQLLDGDAQDQARLLLNGSEQEWWDVVDDVEMTPRSGTGPDVFRQMLDAGGVVSDATDPVLEFRPAVGDSGVELMLAVTKHGVSAAFQRALAVPLLNLGGQCRIMDRTPERHPVPLVVFGPSGPVAVLAGVAVSEERWEQLRTGG